MYRSRFRVCTCDEHCSWDLCRLLEPLDDCLRGTNSEWQWDDLKNAYVAQIIIGIYHTLELIAIDSDVTKKGCQTYTT